MSSQFGTHTTSSDARKELEKELRSVPSASYDPKAGCLPNTRKALLAIADAWVRGLTPSATKSVLIHGHAGSGKTALLSSIAKSLDEAHIPYTYFGCRRDGIDRSDVHRILPTICYDLTKYYEGYHERISGLIRSPEGWSVATGDIGTQSELLFGKTYELISPDGALRPPVHVILIDALDECRDHHDGDRTTDERRSLLDFLLSFANSTSWIKVLITSRPDPDIMDAFTQTAFAVNCIDIESEKWDAPAEIRRLVEVQSSKLKLGLSPDQIDRFQAISSGRFIWYKTVFRLIQGSKGCNSHLVTNILNGELPSSKDDPRAPPYLQYQRALNYAVSGGSDREIMESVLSVIYVTETSTRPLSTSAIAEILYPNEDYEGKREWVENMIKSLSSMLYVEKGTNAVRVRHLSVLAFISGMMIEEFPMVSNIPGDNAAPRFAFGAKGTHTRIFDGCFTLMDRDLRFNTCELEESFRLNKDVPDLAHRLSRHIGGALRYASEFWLSHLMQSNVDTKESAEKVLVFLSSVKELYWIEAMSLMDAVERGIAILQDCAKFFIVRPSSCVVVQQLTVFRVNRASWK